MTPMNNPMGLLIHVLQSGGNPYALMRQMAAQDPRMQQAMRMMQGKTPQQLRQMAQNMANERGVSLGDVARSLGVNLPGGR